jgi:hypothetical protein
VLGFIVTVVMLAAPLATDAQQPGKVPPRARGKRAPGCDGDLEWQSAMATRTYTRATRRPQTPNQISVSGFPAARTLVEQVKTGELAGRFPALEEGPDA